MMGEWITWKPTLAYVIDSLHFAIHTSSKKHVRNHGYYYDLDLGDHLKLLACSATYKKWVQSLK